jgi:hypothetical protein
MQNSGKNVCCRESELVIPSLEDRESEIVSFFFFLNAFHIRYAHATGNDGVTSNLYTFMIFNTKEFRITAASIGGDFHVFEVILKLI